MSEPVMLLLHQPMLSLIDPGLGNTPHRLQLMEVVKDLQGAANFRLALHAHACLQHLLHAQLLLLIVCR